MIVTYFLGYPVEGMGGFHRILREMMPEGRALTPWVHDL